MTSTPGMLGQQASGGLYAGPTSAASHLITVSDPYPIYSTAYCAFQHRPLTVTNSIRMAESLHPPRPILLPELFQKQTNRATGTQTS